MCVWPVSAGNQQDLSARAKHCNYFMHVTTASRLAHANKQTDRLTFSVLPLGECQTKARPIVDHLKFPIGLTDACKEQGRWRERHPQAVVW